ncbi:MAG TPA: SCO2524 family protein [Trebonia sp.]|nr:SCO2524 family protein [Trebonia sp.]
MEIQTRRQILEIWRATISHCYPDGEWNWGGHRSGRNSISDAEQLLTILYPATAIDTMKIDKVDQTADDVLDYLRAMGNALDIPRRLIAVLTEYMRTYQAGGTPDFSGNTYFDVLDDGEATPDPEQLALHVVDSFSMSVSLCLATLGFLQVYREGVKSPRMRKEVEDLEELASRRLTAAMVGLLRSFTINTFLPTDPAGEVMCRMINQGNVPSENLVHDLLDELVEVRSSLQKELSLGLSQVADELDNPGRLFECGWSWGVVDGAPKIDAYNVGDQPAGIADPRPYLYFTVVALDGIQDLFSERTRILGLLTEDQQRLAGALQLRWDLTRQFWAKIATFGSGRRWPIEDVPWVTSDGAESDYYSLLLTSIVIEGVGAQRGVDVDVERVGRLLEELANRGRITRRPTSTDPAIPLHIPGMRLRLYGTEKVAEGPLLQWTVSSYASLLLKRLLRVAELADDKVTRLGFLDLADEIWLHVEGRRIEAQNGRGLWDEPTQVFPGAPYAPYGGPSWYHTERVVEALVAAANVTLSQKASANPDLSQYAHELIAEAEHLFDQELLRGTDDTGVRLRERFQVVGAKLRRARELLPDRPGTAGVLASEVLRELDTVDAARQDTARMS